MELLTKKLITSLILCGVGILPACAQINGGVSKGHLYDVEKTIMTDAPQETSIKNEKYWVKNLFCGNKYRPLFMLSNKELYNLSPEKQAADASKAAAHPSHDFVYSISLKTSSIKRISLSPKPVNAPAKVTAKTSALPKVKAPVVNNAKPQKVVSIPKAEKQLVVKAPKHDSPSISMYEEAKNQGVESQQKIDTALVLKNTKKLSNYDLAIDLLDDVTRDEPYNAYAYYLKGELYAAKKDSENAMKNYVEALKINPCSKQSCIGIAKILEPTNKELAKKYYDMANQENVN